MQSKSKNNFYLTDKYISNKIDEYRSLLINEGKKFLNTPNQKKKLKILHITNFNERHNGRLFYNTGKKVK